MKGSWELKGKETPEQFRLFAHAFLDSSQALTKALIESDQSRNFLLGNPALYLARHAVELYLKGAILTRDSMERPHHELEKLYEQYVALFANDNRCAWNVPFRVEVLGFEATETDSARDAFLKQFPGDQLLPYPADKTMKPWPLVSTFDASTFIDSIATIRGDFERLRPLIFSTP